MNKPVHTDHQSIQTGFNLLWGASPPPPPQHKILLIILVWYWVSHLHLLLHNIIAIIVQLPYFIAFIIRLLDY